MKQVKAAKHSYGQAAKQYVLRAARWLVVVKGRTEYVLTQGTPRARRAPIKQQLELEEVDVAFATERGNMKQCMIRRRGQRKN